MQHYLKIGLFSVLLINTLIITISAQGNEFDAIQQVGSSLNQFTIKLLSETSDQAGDALNLAISPYTIWSLLSIIAEGARENTLRQIEDVLQLPFSDNKDLFRRSYKSFTKYLLQSEPNVELELSSAIFTRNDQMLNRTFEALSNSFYGVDIIPTNFDNLVQATNSINTYVASATRNRILNFINIDDIINADIMLTSTLFFKGEWKIPFNESATFLDTFFDEYGNKKGQVMMMYQIGSYPYSILNNVKAHAVELPYGNGNGKSMIVILPRKGESVQSVLKELTKIPFTNILDTLNAAQQQFGDDDVQIYLPRFTINSDLNMNAVLDNMGIKDVFSQSHANLLGMFPHYLYISRVIQQAQIEVNENGTVAAAAAGASFQNKSPAPKFYANHGFIYFIIDKSTSGILFAGKVSNPSTLCDSCSKKNN